MDEHKRKCFDELETIVNTISNNKRTRYCYEGLKDNVICEEIFNKCPICLTNPNGFVTLQCGHLLCKVCVDNISLKHAYVEESDSEENLELQLLSLCICRYISNSLENEIKY